MRAAVADDLMPHVRAAFEEADNLAFEVSHASVSMA